MNGEKRRESKKVANIMHRYEIDRPLAAILARVDWCCACGRAGDEVGGLAVDHDHDTGQVRGVLCHSCNTALGLLGESDDRINGLHAYMSVWRTVLRDCDDMDLAEFYINKLQRRKRECQKTQ